MAGMQCWHILFLPQAPAIAGACDYLSVRVLLEYSYHTSVLGSITRCVSSILHLHRRHLLLRQGSKQCNY